MPSADPLLTKKNSLAKSWQPMTYNPSVRMSVGVLSLNGQPSPPNAASSAPAEPDAAHPLVRSDLGGDRRLLCPYQRGDGRQPALHIRWRAARRYDRLECMAFGCL